MLTKADLRWTMPEKMSDAQLLKYLRRWASQVLSSGDRDALIQAADDLALAHQLIAAYRAKRAVDGLNGRVWDGRAHLEAEGLVEHLESRARFLAKPEDWPWPRTGDNVPINILQCTPAIFLWTRDHHGQVRRVALAAAVIGILGSARR